MVYCSNVNKNIAQAKIQNEELRAQYLASISTTDTQTLICMIIRNALLEHLNNNN